MNEPATPASVAQEMFRAKRDRRRALAALSFEEKIKILVQLQQFASEIGQEARGKLRKPWQIEP